MRLKELLHGVEYRGVLPEDIEVTGISYDTRTIQPGELFVALRGYKTDGHKYIAEAREKGAVAVVAEEGENTLCVSDSRAALAILSANWFSHPARELNVIGVTGTNGKTTTTTLLWEILRATLGEPVGLIGTNEIRVGEKTFPAQRTTPESWDLQKWFRDMADAGCRYVVMEVSSHALCMHRTDGITFAVGAFTNLTQDHLDFHKTMEEYRTAKGRLFLQSEISVLNVDDEAGRYYWNFVQGMKISYATKRNGANLLAENAEFFPDRTLFDVQTENGSFAVEVGIPGKFTVYNVLCALACSKALGIPLEKAVEVLRKAPGVKGRMETVPYAGEGTVIIDYAHTPDALEKVLSTLRDFTEGRLICLFGCGGERDNGKRALMGAVAERLADVCFVTSDNPRGESPDRIIQDILDGFREREKKQVVVEPDRACAIALALSELRKGDTLLLAGKGHETYQEINGIKRHMDERELVARYVP